MSWARILAPLSGGVTDKATLFAATVLAEPFGAEVAGVYTPPDLAEVMPWMGEGFLGGMQTTALESLRQATEAGERGARAALENIEYAKRRFVSLRSPVWSALSVESRLSDVVVFTDEAARGRGPLAEAFQQMIADEQRPVLIARQRLKVGGTVVVAWDGGKEASRAARLAVPLLEKASRVVVLVAPKALSRTVEPESLQGYYAARGLKADIEVLSESGDAGPMLLAASARLGADILVAGAFGHPRLQEFIFGGATRSLLNSDGPSLFLSH